MDDKQLNQIFAEIFDNTIDSFIKDFDSEKIKNYSQFLADKKTPGAVVCTRNALTIMRGIDEEPNSSFYTITEIEKLCGSSYKGETFTDPSIILALVIIGKKEHINPSLVFPNGRVISCLFKIKDDKFIDVPPKQCHVNIVKFE